MLEEINSRLDDTEEPVSELEDRVMEITQPEWKKKKEKEKECKKIENSLRDLWDNIKHSNIHIIGIPEGEEREKGIENLYENIIAGLPWWRSDWESAC